MSLGTGKAGLGETIKKEVTAKKNQMGKVSHRGRLIKPPSSQKLASDCRSFPNPDSEIRLHHRREATSNIIFSLISIVSQCQGWKVMVHHRLQDINKIIVPEKVKH